MCIYIENVRPVHICMIWSMCFVMGQLPLEHVPEQSEAVSVPGLVERGRPSPLRTNLFPSLQMCCFVDQHVLSVLLGRCVCVCVGYRE